MNRTTSYTLSSFIFICCMNVFSSDTLRTEHLYQSPISNPVTMEYFDNCFWIANLSSPKIYKMNTSMVLIDSIEFHRSRISGLCHKDEKLWIAVDQSVIDVVSPNNNLSYRIYGINLITKSISDSMQFTIGSVSNQDTGIVFGIGALNDTLFVTLNLGWSSGIYSITSEVSPVLKSNTPFSGITLVENGFWGIKHNNNRCAPLIMSLAKPDIFQIEVNGADLAYDGTSIYVCVPEQSSIVKLAAATLRVSNKQMKHLTHGLQSSCKSVSVGGNHTFKNEIWSVALNGRTAGLSKNRNMQFGSQVLIGNKGYRKGKE